MHGTWNKRKGPFISSQRPLTDLTGRSVGHTLVEGTACRHPSIDQSCASGGGSGTFRLNSLGFAIRIRSTKTLGWYGADAFPTVGITIS